MTKETAFAQDLVDFIHASPSPFHVVKNIEDQLAAAGFNKLAPVDRWTLEKGGKYNITRNDSAIIAFVVGSGEVEKEGFRLVAAHTYIKKSFHAFFGA